MAWPARQPSPGEVVLNKNHHLAAELVGWWLFNEKGGIVLHDFSGVGEHGTLTNMSPATDWVISQNPAISGYALNFDGSDDRIVVTNVVDTAVGFSFVVGLNFTSGFKNPADWRGSGNNFIGNVGTRYWGRDASSNRVQPLHGIDTATTQFAFVIDPSGPTGLTYIDGQLNDSDTNASVGTITVNNLSIAGTTGGGLMAGDIDYLIVYNRVLLANEIYELYRNPFAMRFLRKRSFFVPVVAGIIQKRKFLRRQTDPNFWLEW